MYTKKGVELRNSVEKGEGVFATRTFKIGETVMAGAIGEVLRENNLHASQIDENKYVILAGLSCKVNHSCDPNCGIRVNETGAHDYIARKEIGIHEEITFDYAMQNYSIEHFPDKCLCNTDKCRGKVTGWKDLTEERKKEYEGFAAPYLLELDAGYVLEKG